MDRCGARGRDAEGWLVTSITLDPSQLRAVELALTARVGIITGGPGVGKTTITRATLDRLDEARDNALRMDHTSWTSNPVAPYLLAAPTGKAARRMSEATGREAMTIHRLLKYGMGKPWGHTRHYPLATACVIVDEASMVDVELAAALFDAIDPETTRLILVGDRNQLPSVGAGKVFADLISSGAVPVAELTTLHRSAAESWVCRNAPLVLEGSAPDLRPLPDFQWANVPTAYAAAQAALSWSRQMEAQILIPQRTTDCGTNAVNRLVQAETNPKRQGEAAVTVKGRDEAGSYEIRPRDRVIQTKNDYDRDVMNGETGVVLDVTETGAVTVDFDGREVVLTGLDVHRLQLAYALTIHKSQGSEWPWVVVVCHSSHTHMLSRALLYTAITRAKKGVVLVGDEKGLERALGNDRDARRNTTLAQRIQYFAAQGAAQQQATAEGAGA